MTSIPFNSCGDWESTATGNSWESTATGNSWELTATGNNKYYIQQNFSNAFTKSFTVRTTTSDATSASATADINMLGGYGGIVKLILNHSAWDDNCSCTIEYESDNFFTPGNCQRLGLLPLHRESLQDRLRDVIQRRQFPGIRTDSKTKAVGHPSEEREQRARETLRMIVGEVAYRRFLKTGFVIARNSHSGHTYQIFHGHHRLTHVYKDGKMVDRLCIYLEGNFPPTDFVITMYLLALNNDNRIWEVGNRNGLPSAKPSDLYVPEERSLPEIFRELKGLVA